MKLNDNTKLKLWRFWDRVRMFFSEYSGFTGLALNYTTEFDTELGPYCGMKVNGKPIAIRITGTTLIGVGAIQWMIERKDLHHIIVATKGLCEFERHCLEVNCSYTILEGHFPPKMMAKKVKDLIDK